MGLFSKPKIPGINTGALTAINEETAGKQRNLISQRLAGVQPINQQFETQRKAMSASIDPGAEKVIGQYGQDLSTANTVAKNEGTLAADQFRQQQFRDVPEMQKMIRNQLGGNRMLGSGAALSSLAKPTLQAAQASFDFTASQEAQQLADTTRRADALASGGFSVRQKATADRLGLDEDTLNQLTQMGRGDIIDKFNSLAGVESEYGANKLSIEQARQANDIAQAQASAQRRAGMYSLGGQVIGGLAGSFGGPMGAAVGSQLGGQIGNMAGGGDATQFDPTLLFALAQQRRASSPATQKTAFIRGSGPGSGRVPVRG